jgi:subtilisin-like proprotein convertase family protein
MKGKKIKRKPGGIPENWKQALTKAREDFGKYESCLGVNFCEKRKGGIFNGENAIVVYVRQKIRDFHQVPEGEMIPERFEGCRTDVVEPFSKDRTRKHLDYLKDHYRSHDLAAVDLGKIHQFRFDQLEALDPIERTGVVGEVFIIEDKEGRLVAEENGETFPDIIESYKVFRENYGDEFDFVTFFSDIDSGMPTFDFSFHKGFYNDIKGIGLPEFNLREWLGGSEKLQSLHFLHHTHFNRYVMLHEFGHRWGAFVTFRESSQGPKKYDLLIQEGAGAFDHWARYFDDDLSPMDYDEIDWEEIQSGTFRAVVVPHINRKYCNLDLYLMGLLTPDQVGPFYYLENIRDLGQSRYSADKKELQIQNIIWAEKQRNPTAVQAQKSFRQAYVLLSKDLDRATSLAETIDRLRRDFTADFAEATGNRATVDARLKPNHEVVSGGHIRQEYHRQLSIPDQISGRLPSSVESTLAFFESEIIKDIEIELDVKHTYIGDLRILIVGPDGTEAVIHDQEGGNAVDIKKTYTPDDSSDLQKFIGKSARGNWVLRLTDLWPDDKGQLESWAIKLGFEGNSYNERPIPDAKESNAEEIDKIISEYLSYQDAEIGDQEKEKLLQTNFGYLNKSATNYAGALIEIWKKHDKHTIEKAVNDLLGQVSSILKKLGISSRAYGESRTWAYWDIAKQYYYVLNPDEADPKYTVADPVEDSNKFEEIANRHIGWEVYAAFKQGEEKEFLNRLDPEDLHFNEINLLLNKEPKKDVETLGSKDLSELGRLIRECIIDE